MKSKILQKAFSVHSMASQTGIEPATFRLGGEPSILLRYWDVCAVMKTYRLSKSQMVIATPLA